MIYFIIGLVVGILGTYLVMRDRLLRRRTPRNDSNGIDIPDALEHKAENLAKARSFLKGKTKITNDDLQKELGVSDATIVRYLNELEQEGAIKQIGKTGQSVYYEVI